MAYRTAAKIEARRRPAPSLVLPGKKLRAAIAASGLSIVGAVLALPAARGVTIDCSRERPGALPVCEVDDPGTFFFGGTRLRFDGHEHAFSAVASTVAGDTPTTTVHVGDAWRSGPLAADRAYTAAIAYGAFVRTPDAMRFERRMPPSGFSVVLPGILLVVGAAFFLSGARRFERSIALIIDAEVDEVVVETRWLRRASAVDTVPLSAIEAVNAVPVEDSDRYDLCASMIDGARRPLLRVGHFDCEAAASVLKNAIRGRS